MSECECPLAGFCERHQINKGPRWHHLCQTRPNYREAWDRLAAGESVKRQATMERKARQSKRLIQKGRECWRRLFSEVETPEDLQDWEQTIPRYGCNCKRFYDEWIKANPPEINGGRVAFRWKWSLKSAVNRHLGHADLTLEEAAARWGYSGE